MLDAITQRTTFYDLSGGMESAAMVFLERQRIKQTKAIVRWVDTGKQFPEMYDSISQIESVLGLSVIRLKADVTFDQFLFEPGPRGGYGIIRKGVPDCSRVMKRQPLSVHMRSLPSPYEVNIGFNRDETDRADRFSDLNEKEWLHWRYPLIENDIDRSDTKRICQEAGFTILLDMYKKMGRFDCFWCGNQTPEQALNVARYYPDLASEWMEAEQRKRHSFMPIPLKVLIERKNDPEILKSVQETGCSCFGGESFWVEPDDLLPPPPQQVNL